MENIKTGKVDKNTKQAGKLESCKGKIGKIPKKKTEGKIPINRREHTKKQARKCQEK